jgi:hypothetical protein
MIERKSGYDPATQVCWQFHNKGDGHPSSECRCPAHAADVVAGQEMFFFGRCRSGKRWFWRTGYLPFGEQQPKQKRFGWADSEELATAAAMAAVRELRDPRLPVVAHFDQGMARRTLRELNAEKRRQRPPPDTSDTRVTEYLYNRGGRPFRILKKTKQRIYYNRSPFQENDPAIRDYYGIGYVNRRELERDGEIWSHKSGGWWEEDARLYLKPPQMHVAPRAPKAPAPDLQKLKAEMAAAHPDRGGSSAAFIAARARYVEARRALRRGARA